MVSPLWRMNDVDESCHRHRSRQNQLFIMTE
jgi:hypothetical protein